MRVKLDSSFSTRREGMGLPKGYADIKSKYIFEEETLSGLPNIQKSYLVLGIETSCDDTGVAVVSSNGTILSNVVFSQSGIHENFGGIVPSLAMEAHKSNIDKAIAKALEDSGQTFDSIDAVAVTKGPGLEICLRVGCRKAQEVARTYNKPFVTVHHLEAHCLLARLAGVEMNAETLQSTSVVVPSSGSTNTTTTSTTAEVFEPKVAFPFLALLVSGGHTSILICHGLGDYTVLGATLDDSLGEAFDKASRLLGLRTAGCGGAAVEITAREGNINHSTAMKVPMKRKINCDFSYAGLKNAFRLEVQKARESLGLDTENTNAPANQMEQISKDIVTLPPNVCADLCATFQEVAFAHIEDRIHRALDYIDDNAIPVDSLVVVGGVASNLELRRKLLNLIETRHQAMLCTDNGVMAAWAGIEKLNLGVSNSVENQEVIARWPLGSTLPRKDAKNVNSGTQASQSSHGGEGGSAIDQELVDAALQNPFPSKNSRKAREKLLSKLRIVGSNVPIIAAQQPNSIDGDLSESQEPSSSSSTIR
eukprot:gene26129-34740_t